MIVYILSVMLIIWTLFVCGIPFADNVTMDADGFRQLLHLEEQMYMKMNPSDKDTFNTECPGMRSSSMLTKISAPSACAKDVRMNVINPVHMKVFAWTRSYELKKETMGSCDPGQECPAADVLFCENAFEQHWGLCRERFQANLQFSQTWQNYVGSSIEMPVFP